ncbi:MAG: acyl-CoA dehydrogenase family protein [Acidimicrobiia bacterium]
MTTTPFTQEHDLLRSAIRDWLESEIVPHLTDWERDGFLPNAVFHRAGELGFFGLNVPVEDGGQGGDYWAHVVFLEEIGRVSQAIATALAVQTDMCTPPIRQFGTEEQKQRYLTPALRGELIGAIGITEPDAGSDVAAIRTRAVRDGEDWVISGSKMYITNGARADFVTMVVRTGPAQEGAPWSGISMFIVDTDLPGFELSRSLSKAGLKMSDTALLYLDEVRVPAGALLGVEGEGFSQIMWELQGERLAVAVYGLAGCRALLDTAIDYARERRAFGRPIGDFQALAHRLAQVATEVEAVGSLVYEACDLWNRGVYATEEIAMAKLAVGQLAALVSDEAVQTFGGYGLAEDSPVAREWLTMRIGRIGAGTDEVQREVLAKILELW